MENKKFQISLIVIILLVFVGIYYNLGGVETSTREKMLNAVADHRHEKAVIYASQILDSAPSDMAAQKVLKESGQIFFYLHAAKEKLSEFKVAENSAEIEPEKLYENFKKAREYAAKAKALDPQFKNTLRFEKTLDKAQTKLLQILSINAIEFGQKAFSTAVDHYQKNTKLVSTAASSGILLPYLAVQSSWALNLPADQVKEQLDPYLTKINTIGQWVPDHAENTDQDFVRNLLTYIEVTRTTVDTLSVPKGSYNHFAKIADESVIEYNEAQNKLAKTVPGSSSIKKNYSRLTNIIDKYKVYNRDSTAQIISDNQSLYEL